MVSGALNHVNIENGKAAVDIVSDSNSKSGGLLRPGHLFTPPNRLQMGTTLYNLTSSTLGYEAAISCILPDPSLRVKETLVAAGAWKPKFLFKRGRVAAVT